MGRHLVRTEGVPGLFRGLSAALLRQGMSLPYLISYPFLVFYSGSRFAVYDLLKSKLSSSTQSPPLWQTVPMAATAGAVGALIGNPCDLAMVRLQADSNRPIAERRNYRNVFDAISRVTR